jgi:hypothetical protein
MLKNKTNLTSTAWKKQSEGQDGIFKLQLPPDGKLFVGICSHLSLAGWASCPGCGCLFWTAVL